jgi:hypothetical protein
MLDAGQEEDALAVLAGVAEELSAGGQPELAITILKRVDHIRRHDEQGGPDSRAATEAGFREWVGSVLRDEVASAARSLPRAEEEGADGEGDGQGRERAGEAAEAR